MTAVTTALNRLKWATFQAYLQLMRPANIVTAWADILAGYGAGLSMAGIALGSLASSSAVSPLLLHVLWLLLATTGLYGGGVTFNDVFDASLDATERAERPIPSGRASLWGAVCLGIGLLVLGVGAAAQVSLISGGLAGAITLLALTYNKFSKHHTVAGPLNMGLCRGLNLLLGVSAIVGQVPRLWFLSLIPLGYIGAITAISQGEVKGSERSTAWGAMLLLGLTVALLFALSALPAVDISNLLPFTLLLSILVFPAFIQAAKTLTADDSRAAVKAGILALIVLDASIASGFAGWPYGLAMLTMLPLSKGISRLFSVT